jgi:hypothetical protein
MGGKTMREVTLLEMGLQTLDLLKSPADFRSWLCATKGYDGTPGSLHGRRFLGRWSGYGLNLWLNRRLPKFPGRLWVYSYAVIAVFEGFTMPRGYPGLMVFAQSPKWVSELIRSLEPKKTATGEEILRTLDKVEAEVQSSDGESSGHEGELLDLCHRFRALYLATQTPVVFKDWLRNQPKYRNLAGRCAPWRTGYGFAQFVEKILEDICVLAAVDEQMIVVWLCGAKMDRECWELVGRRFPLMPAPRWLLRLVKAFRPRDRVYPGEVIDYLNREFAGEREDADSKPS